jgi:hypothetical protein
MLRRDFLKNSIGALLGVALTSNNALASIVETLTPESPKVLLYLIQLTSGEWKIRTTKWVDVPTKRLNESNIIKESFKALDIVDLNQVVNKRFEYWKEYNCSGRMGCLLSLGIPMTEEMKKEYSDFNKVRHIGVKRPLITGKRISEKAKGRPSHMKGKTWNEEVKKNMSEGSKNRKYTDEGREKRKNNSIGEKNNFFGKKHTTETKKIILEKHPSKIKITCEHCNKKLDLPNYKRYHGEKCKLLNPNAYKEKFLFSDRSLKIIDLLENNKSYNQITKSTGYSKNLIIKTNRLYKSTFLI